MIPLKTTIYEAHGKLLLTGEYFVLDGAEALAVPTQKGQSLQQKEEGPADELHWRSLTHEGHCWFESSWRWSGDAVQLLHTNEPQVAARFLQLLLAINTQDAHALATLFGKAWEIQLEFPRDWGLGSSSTLISLLAQLTRTNPYAILAASFGGSGYDLACAQADGAILYKLREGQAELQTLDWEPAYRHQVHFVHLGHKQNSREGIRMYRELGGTQITLVDEVSALTHDFLAANDLKTAAQVTLAHEELVSNALYLPRVQTQYFQDFPGVVKSLGAWGGDFVMVLSELSAAETRSYFRERGYTVVLPWSEMILGAS